MVEDLFCANDVVVVHSLGPTSPGEWYGTIVGIHRGMANLYIVEWPSTEYEWNVFAEICETKLDFKTLSPQPKDDTWRCSVVPEACIRQA
jgi:hypothetical protein